MPAVPKFSWQLMIKMGLNQRGSASSSSMVPNVASTRVTSPVSSSFSSANFHVSGTGVGECSGVGVAAGAAAHSQVRARQQADQYGPAVAQNEGLEGQVQVQCLSPSAAGGSLGDRNGYPSTAAWAGQIRNTSER